MDPRRSLAGLSLRDLEYAASVGRTRHFGRAALACNVSQAALSEQVQKLEHLLGARLFERARGRVAPTPVGETVLRQIDRVLAEAYAVLDVARSSRALGGQLRLGAIATLGPYYLPHVLRQVRAALPDLALQLTEGQTDPLLDRLRRAVLDVALVALPAPPDLEAALLFFEPFLLACPAGHPLATQPHPALTDLAQADLVLLEEGHCLRDQALSLCAAGPSHRRHATSLETLWHMIAAREGVSLLPALSTSGRDTLASLVTVRPLPEPEAGRTIALVWRRTDPRTAEFKRLADVLRADLPDGVVAG